MYAGPPRRMRKSASHCTEHLKYAAASRALMSAVDGIASACISAIRIPYELIAEYWSSSPRMTKRMRNYFGWISIGDLADRCP